MKTPNSAHEPQLVTKGGNLPDDGFRLVGDDEPAETGQSILSFARALNELPDSNGYFGVRINPGDDVRLLMPFLDKIALVEVAFPGFRDGRGYSSARILREAGYTQRLRAVGDVLRDQVFYMLRCGFDEFLLKDADPQEAVRSAAQRFTTTYQSAADANRPTWALRHTVTA